MRNCTGFGNFRKIERENEEARGQFLSLEAVMEALEKCGYTDVAERLLKEIS